MDLAKFISLLSKEALYFACPTEFSDSYEGYMPKSWLMEPAQTLQKQHEQVESMGIQAANLPRSSEDVSNVIDACHDGINNAFENVIQEIISTTGVNCWHKSDYESEAMWKLYSTSGQGIAIESTIGQLRDSIIDNETLEIENVRYISENDPKENYGVIFLKRKSFEHEKELRATVSLRENGKGTLVKCDLDKLINHIYISPFAEPYFKEIVENICVGKVQNINKPITQSILFDKPNYTVKALLAGS